MSCDLNWTKRDISSPIGVLISKYLSQSSADLVDLELHHHTGKGQSQAGAAQFLGDGIVALIIAEMLPIERLQMDGLTSLMASSYLRYSDHFIQKGYCAGVPDG